MSMFFVLYSAGSRMTGGLEAAKMKRQTEVEEGDLNEAGADSVIIRPAAN